MAFTNALVIFAKAPRPGRVKTRLIGRLTPRQAAEVHRACLADSIALARGVRGTRKWLFVAAAARAAQRLAADLRIGKEWKIASQRGADLGERMLNAFTLLLRSGARRVVIIGTDSPWMGRTQIRQAFRALRRADVVLGPSADGGYYLIGARCVIPEIFQGIPWGTSSVFSRTLRALRSCRKKFSVLPADFDLDRPEDLQRVRRLLGRKPGAAPSLKRWLAAWEGTIESSRPRPRPRRHRTPQPVRA